MEHKNFLLIYDGALCKNHPRKPTVRLHTHGNTYYYITKAAALQAFFHQNEKQRLREARPPANAVLLNVNQPAFGADTGQTPAQAPHSMQVSASITYLLSPAEIALTGHSPSQAPHMMQSSEITYAILNTPPLRIQRRAPAPLRCYLYCNTFSAKSKCFFTALQPKPVLPPAHRRSTDPAASRTTG